jgi:tetratricopeptide (TPR) repeat protein
MNRGAKLLEQGKATEALPFLYEAASLRPDDVDAAINLGGAHIMLGRFQRAIAILEEAAENEPANSKVWINLGGAYLGNPETATPEQQAEAIAAFEQALELDPAAPSVDYNLGLIYRDQERLELALAHFRRAAAINPMDRDARILVQRLENLHSESDRTAQIPDDGGNDG